jgi:2-polyprenyl-3-methyl-5-hydroxy-6-metoxy-1,4-benzoquinol methylase
VRHAEWYRFRKEVIDYAKSNGDLLYQPVTHPDLCHIPSLHGDEEFEIIKANLPMQGGDLLDIEAHWGYFCHSFEELGFNCYAVETNSSNLYFLDKLRIAENRKFKIISGSIFEYHEKNDFDVILALNVFHNFAQREDTYYSLIDLLKGLDMKVMFFQAEPTVTPQMKSTLRNFKSEEFIDVILKNSKLNECICIGKTKQGGPIYRLQSI